VKIGECIVSITKLSMLTLCMGKRVAVIVRLTWSTQIHCVGRLERPVLMFNHMVYIVTTVPKTFFNRENNNSTSCL